MADIYWGLALIGLLAVALFFGTVRLTRDFSQLNRDLLAFLVVGLLFVYIRFCWYNPRLTKILPFSNLIVLGNWFPLAAAMLGGLAWQRIPGRVLRKMSFVGALLGTSVYSLVCPFLGEKPECTPIWQRGVCIQSTEKTCTPACAATLLRCYGIPADENEMTSLCLTREGTTWMGLYRALKLKTAGTPWDVEVVSCDAGQLIQNRQGPMILSVGLPPDCTSDVQSSARLEWGWQPGLGHSVVLCHKTPQGRYLIADPTPGIGEEEWTTEDVGFLFRGTAMRLVRRS